MYKQKEQKTEAHTQQQAEIPYFNHLPLFIADNLRFGY